MRLFKIMDLPQFKYSPNCYDLENEIFTYSEEGVLCECCNEKTNYYYDIMMYSLEDTECICPNCISSGKAAKKFDGEFIQYSENSQIIDKIKRKELFEKTPGYVSWQGEYWLECCNDYCAFIGYVGIKELEDMGIKEEVFKDYESKDGYEIELVKQCLERKGSLAGYLFQCIHCGKYRIWVDAS